MMERHQAPRGSAVATRDRNQLVDNSRLNNLPPEIRNIIYAFVLRAPSGSVLLSPRGHEQRRWSRNEQSSALAILLTCRQIYQDAAGLFYNLNHLSFQDIDPEPRAANSFLGFINVLLQRERDRVRLIGIAQISQSQRAQDRIRLNGISHLSIAVRHPENMSAACEKLVGLPNLESVTFRIQLDAIRGLRAESGRIISASKRLSKLAKFKRMHLVFQREKTNTWKGRKPSQHTREQFATFVKELETDINDAVTQAKEGAHRALAAADQRLTRGATDRGDGMIGRKLAELTSLMEHQTLSDDDESVVIRTRKRIHEQSGHDDHVSTDEEVHLPLLCRRLRRGLRISKTISCANDAASDGDDDEDSMSVIRRAYRRCGANHSYRQHTRLEDSDESDSKDPQPTRSTSEQDYAETSSENSTPDDTRDEELLPVRRCRLAAMPSYADHSSSDSELNESDSEQYSGSEESLTEMNEGSEGSVSEMDGRSEDGGEEHDESNEEGKEPVLQHIRSVRLRRTVLDDEDEMDSI